MRIAIIGCGFVGSAMKAWLEDNNKEVEILVSDPAKGFHDDVYNADVDAYFISVHVPTLNDGSQDISDLVNIVKKIPVDKPVWVRTTILPSTLNELQHLTLDGSMRPVFHMPEFLTQRTYIDDFKHQTMVFTGGEFDEKYVDLLKNVFPGKKFITMNSYEASIAKYAHNVFGALKVTYFNCLRDICNQMSFDACSNEVRFDKVREGVLASGYINETHTQVPGPDDKFGYGGKCFPKDVDAFEREFRYSSIGRLIDPLKKLNNQFRCLK